MSIRRRWICGTGDGENNRMKVSGKQNAHAELRWTKLVLSGLGIGIEHDGEWGGMECCVLRQCWRMSACDLLVTGNTEN